MTEASNSQCSTLPKSHELPDWRRIRAGKVRELYMHKRHENVLLLFASDRISAFDCVLEPEIPDKGYVLTKLSNWWCSKLPGKNHLLENYDPELHDKLLKNIPEHILWQSTICRKVEIIPFECVVRGYLAGSAWAHYEATHYQTGDASHGLNSVHRSRTASADDAMGGKSETYGDEMPREHKNEHSAMHPHFAPNGADCAGTPDCTYSAIKATKNCALCGLRSNNSGLPLRHGDKLPEPIFTPTTKSTEKDIPIEYSDLVCAVGENLARQLRERCIEYYTIAEQIALTRGLIIADAKFEFGLIDGEVCLADEVLTPDSARYWQAIDREKNGHKKGDQEVNSKSARNNLHGKNRNGTNRQSNSRQSHLHNSDSHNRLESFDKQIVRDWLQRNWFQRSVQRRADGSPVTELPKRCSTNISVVQPGNLQSVTSVSCAVDRGGAGKNSDTAKNSIGQYRITELGSHVAQTDRDEQAVADPPPQLPQDLVRTVSQRYKDLLKILTG